MADKEEKARTGLVEGTDPLDGDDASGEIPMNQRARAGSGKRQPAPGVTKFRVRTRGVEKFQRCGISFTVDPVIVTASSLTPEQQVELLNTPTLNVEEMTVKEKPQKA